MKKLLAIIIFSIYTIKVRAQGVELEFVDDPLKKPHIWAKLVEKPSDSKLWGIYVGKDLFDLSNDESLNLQKWRALLIKKNEEAHLKEQLAIRTLQKKEALVISEAVFKELLVDITSNFVIIEDYLSMRFKSYGINYVYYKEAHPNTQYSKSLWVAEHESKLLQHLSSK